MDIEDIKLKDVLTLLALFNNVGNKPVKENAGITNNVVGRYVIVRARNEGINCGKVVTADETGVVIEDARRIYYHRPKDKNVSWYEGVAETGLSDDSKISGVVSKKYIIEDYSLTICSDLAEKSLRNHDATKS